MPHSLSLSARPLQLLKASIAQIVTLPEHWTTLTLGRAFLCMHAQPAAFFQKGRRCSSLCSFAAERDVTHYCSMVCRPDQHLEGQLKHAYRRNCAESVMIIDGNMMPLLNKGQDMHELGASAGSVL